MRHLIAILPVSCLLATLSCEQPGQITRDGKVEVSNRVRQTLNDYHNDIRETGLMAEFKYLDNSRDFFWTPPGYASSISYDSVARLLRRNAPLYQSIDNRWDTLRIIALTADLAAYTGRLRSTVTDTSGHVFRMQLVETGLLIKRPDGWKLLCGQTTSTAD